MKKFLLSFVILFATTVASNAQEFKEMITSGNYTVAQISENAEAYFEIRGKGKGTGYKQFKRWQYMARRKMNEQGFLTPTEDLLKEFQLVKANFQESRMSAASNWEEMGPTTWNATSGWNPGVGRVTSFDVDPSDQDHIVIGSPSGGVWRTTTGGSTWTVLTDDFINMDVYALAIHPVNKDTYYWGSTSGVIFITTDAGTTWNELVNLPGGSVNKILIHPTTPDIMFCSIAGGGIFRSTNAGASWSSALTSESTGYDIEFKPGDTNTIYATGNNFYRSTNGGTSFAQISSPFTAGQTKMIGVSTVNGGSGSTTTVYVVEENNGIFGGLYKSTDSGQTFTELSHSANYFGYSDTGNDSSGQAPRDMDIVVAPNDVQEVHIAGIHTWRSLNGGVSFDLTSYWSIGGATSRNVGYCHADVDIMAFIGNDLYVGSDGGLFVNPDSDGTIDLNMYTDLTAGLGIRQFYKIGVSQTDPEILVGGSQDNGSSFYNTSGNWFDWLGADGMEGFIDKNNSNIFYGTSQGGTLYKSVDGGASRSNLATPPGSGNWVTPFEQDPVTSNVIYVGYGEVYKSTNGGSSWGAISNNVSGNLDEMKIAPTNNQVIYASAGETLYKTTNGGATASWSTPSGFGGVINSIAIHPNNEDVVALVTTDSNKVYVTQDGGATWTQKRLNLPNFSALSVVWDDSVNNRLYVGMNYGIYYIDDTVTEWQLFSNNLPNVSVTELEINFATEKIYAGTYGRGAWRSPLEPDITTPVISFSSIAESQLENTDCSFTDHDITLTIANPPSADAEVTFNVDGASTATQNSDFELLTSSVTFTNGSTTSQTMTVRVFHDEYVELDETIIINTSLDVNGGNAEMSSTNNIFTLTISNDDFPLSTTSTVTLFSEDMETAPYEVSTNQSGNGSDAWNFDDTAGATSTYWNTDGLNTTTFAYTNDDACNCDKSNDLLTTSAIDLSTGYLGASLSFDHAFADVGSETAEVLISTDGGSTFLSALTISNTSTSNGGGSFTTPWVYGETLSLNPYIGQPDVRIQFRYNDGGAWSYGMAVDNVQITAEVDAVVQTAANSGTPDQLNLNGIGDAYSSDPVSNFVMMGMSNNDSFDYGCTDTFVSRSGAGAQTYNGSASPDLVMDKTFTITPSNTNGSGDTTITFYFADVEASGWETAVAPYTTADMIIGREVGGAIVETAVATEGSFGNNVTFTGNFTGLNGTYYFGPMEAFVPSCLGALKTWNGTSWSPTGAPGSGNQVMITGNYNTSVNGNLEACKLTVDDGAQFVVTANMYVDVQGDISVNNGSLIVRHQGTVRQLDDSAVVTKNGASGTIQVELTTPVLKTRDFMVMGTPMTDETRTGVYNSAFMVLGFTPANFLPHPDVPAGGTNWADDDGNFYNNLTSGSIEPGKGYVVRPQNGWSDPANMSYNFTHERGVFNNGVVSYTNTNNGPTANPDGTPNVVSNPYPSAISADAFMTNNGLTALYFWEHITPPGTGLSGSNLRFDMDDISIRNMGMGVAAANGGSPPNNVVSTGQGFGIRTAGVAGSTGTISFNNSMRLTSGNTTLRSPQSTPIETLTLEVRNPSTGIGAFTGMAFAVEGSAELDEGYDTKRLGTVVSLYTHLDDGSHELGIQTRGLFDTEMQIPMGFATQMGEELGYNYKISIEDVAGPNIENATVYLLDNSTGIVTNLSEDSYSFTSSVGSYNERFTVFFEAAVLSAADNSLASKLVVYPNPTSGLIQILSVAEELISKVELRDLQGRIIQTITPQKSKVTIDLEGLASATYVLMISSESGTVAKRVMKE